MKLFSSVVNYLGIDIGTSSIKLVELENFKGQAKLKTYGYAEVPATTLKGVSDKNNQAIADYINNIIQKSGAQAKYTIASLPTFSVFNFIINLPPMPKKDMEAAVRWEAKKYIPVPIEEMILSWIILPKKKSVKIVNSEKKNDYFDKEEGAALGSKPSDEKNNRILLTAAPKNLVARYLDIFKKAKLNLISLDTEAFALSRSLVGSDQSAFMIVDIGAQASDICIIEEGVPILNRGIDSGGENITQAIMGSLSINQERAEQFKRDFGLSSTNNNVTGVKNIPEVIQQSLASVVNEIKYVNDVYSRQGSRLDKVILTGGSAFLPNFSEYLSSLLNISVIIGDPWDRIMYPMDLKPVLQEVGPRMAVSIGLAMRDI